MVPSWVHLTLKDINREDELIPRLTNTAYNNWSNIGGVGASKYGIIDSRGLLTARFDSGSVDFWLVDNESILYPALFGKDDPQLRLVSTEDQIYEWKAHLKSVEFNRLVYHVEKEQNEFIYNEVILRNHDLEKAKITFFVAIRPMSLLGFEPIETAEFVTDSQCLFINDYLSLILTERPTEVIFSENSNHELPDLLLADSISSDTQMKYPSGQGIVLLRYDIDLPPAGSESIIFASPLNPYTKDDDLNQISPTMDDRDISVGKWFSFADTRVDALFPEDVLNTAFSQSTVSLVIQAIPALFPDESHFASFSWKERMRILLALVRSSCIDVATQVSASIIERVQIPQGYLDLSIFSPILWGLLQLSDHKMNDFAMKNSQYLRKLTLAVVEALQSASESDDVEELLQGYVVIDDLIITKLSQQLWNYASLKSALTHFENLNDSEMIEMLKKGLEQVQNMIVESCQEIRRARWPRPDDPKMHAVEDNILDLLSTVALLHIMILEQPFLDMLVTRILNRRIVHNLWKSFVPKEQYSSHKALRLAHYFALMTQREKVQPLLKKAIDFLTEDYLLPEFVNIRSFGGDEGTGASVNAAADLILLLRDMLLVDEKPNLILLAGIPEDWFTSKKPLIINNLPTTYESAHIEIGTSANQHQIQINMEMLPDEFEFHVPASVPLPMVKAYGASIVDRVSKTKSPLLRVVPYSNEVVLTFHK